MLSLVHNSIIAAFIYSSVIYCALASYQTAVADQGDPGSVEELPPSRNQIMKFTNAGIEPRVVRIKATDSILFFLNDSSDALVTLEVGFGDKSTHCSSSNMKIEKAGMVRSKEPFPPKGFATVCFHDSGTYPVKVYGLKGKSEFETASVIVE